MTTSARRARLLALAAGLVAVAAIAVPALGGAVPPAGGDPVPVAAESEKPGNGPPEEKPGKGPKSEKVPSSPVTLTGLVGSTQDEGRTVYTLTVGSTVYDLSAGPPWWWGDANPLAKHVGDVVTVTGEQPEGMNEVDVLTVDGTAIREPGRPPWAGGWKVVGEKHPGWSQEKADRQAAKDKAKAERGIGRPSWAGPKSSATADGD